MDNSKLKESYIFGEHLIDDKARQQFAACLAAPYSLRGALMADAHMGYSLPIGGVMWTENVVVPAYVGYDIGCGMMMVRTTYAPSQIKAHAEGIYAMLKSLIPTGFQHHTNGSQWTTLPDGVRSDASSVFNTIYHDKKGDLQLGTMGGNNHYIEIGLDQSGYVCFVVHSGSRGIGHGVATHYMKLAGGGKCREGNYPLMFDSQDGQSYWKDMNACLDFAKLNRQSCLAQIEEGLDRMGFIGRIDHDSTIDTVHNYAEWITPDRHQVMHRKGATKIHSHRESIVAGNPVVGTFIVIGRPDRPVSLDSVSHGMGRVGSRKQANKDISTRQVENEMKHVVGKIKREEAPSAYKPVGDVMDAQSDLLTIENQIKPILCLKG